MICSTTRHVKPSKVLRVYIKRVLHQKSSAQCKHWVNHAFCAVTESCLWSSFPQLLHPRAEEGAVGSRGGWGSRKGGGETWPLGMGVRGWVERKYLKECNDVDKCLVILGQRLGIEPMVCLCYQSWFCFVLSIWCKVTFTKSAHWYPWRECCWWIVDSDQIVKLSTSLKVPCLWAARKKWVEISPIVTSQPVHANLHVRACKQMCVREHTCTWEKKKKTNWKSNLKAF